MMKFSLRKISAAVFAVLFLTAGLASSFGQKKIVLIAGALDDHPLGSHEYENNVLLLKDCLEHAQNLHGLKTEVYFNGWPDDASALDDADTIVFTTGGSDRKETDHPLYVGDHFAQLEKQMKRGCGLVLIHWSTFHPSRVSEKILDWVGGYFDYETGTNGPTKKWFSQIENHEWSVIPFADKHPICRGVKPFSLKEEFYFNLRFRENDPRFTPILLNAPPSYTPKNVVGWAVERADGGRSFGFTGGHFYTNWWIPDFRKLVLNAIAWSAKLEVPDAGVESVISKKIQNFPSQKSAAAKNSGNKKILPASAADPSKLAKEEDWIDGRWNQMDNGPFVSTMIDLDKDNTVLKGLCIRLGDHEEAAVCYDTGALNLRAGWTGKFVAFDPARFGFVKNPKLAGDLKFVSPPKTGWNKKDSHYSGFALSGKRVVLSYEIDGTMVRESPWFETNETTSAFIRTFEVGASETEKTLNLLEVKDGHAKQTTNDGVVVASIEYDGKFFAAAVKGTPNTQIVTNGEQIAVKFSPQQTLSRCKIYLWAGAANELDGFVAMVKASLSPDDLNSLGKPGAGRWPELTTRGQVAFPTEAYVIDTITVPYDNPWKALMFLSGVDFFENGDAAVCTIHGDVWLVRGIDSGLQKISWKRFATGLYQPLGLKIVNDKIFVLGRDQITRLHDRNNDREADFYESFFNGIQTESGHKYVTSLETDAQKNFYYADEEGVHFVSNNGKRTEILATGFRNPNGMSVSPEGVITVAPQEGNWTPSSAICEIKRGGHYGYGGPRVTADRPLGYDAPLVWMPRLLDNSTGGQLWVTSDRWGPFTNQLFNLSYGRCAMMLVMRDVVDGQAQGAVLPWKLRFLSGVMRGTFRKQDGQLYLVGSLGWTTSASKDGCFQRVRYTGKKVYSPEKFHVCENGIELGFTQPLDRETAEDVGSYAIEQWNYHYSKDYGSKEYSVAAPEAIGHDPVEVESAKLLPDGKTVFLKISGLKPVMQMHIKFNVNSADGKPMQGDIYNTINRVGAARNPS